MVVGRLCLLLIGQSDCHTPQCVQNLLGVLVTHCVFRGAVQPLCKEVLDLFHNGLLFFLGQVGIFRQPLGELLAASCALASPLMKSKIISLTASYLS